MMESRVQKRVEQRIIVCRFALQRFAICIFEQDVDVHAAAAHVQAAIFAKFHIVHEADLAVQDGLHRLFDIGGVSGFFDKIVAAAASYETERNVVEVVDSAKHLVKRAVAAHNHNVCVRRF